MTSLFSEKLVNKIINAASAPSVKSISRIHDEDDEKTKIIQDALGVDDDSNSQSIEDVRSFKDLRLCDWICQSTAAMGFKKPTPIQAACIPAILSNRDVMGCAETGSGKTAAFALPILHTLSQDPYGIYAIVLTPTRELAIQIAEQFAALGAPISIKTCLIIGGLNMTQQSIQLSRKPHVIIATPGRLRAHLMSCDPPNLNKVKYIVLDEADRLLSIGFETELQIILESTPKSRQTLLFSATLTTSLSTLETLASKNTLRFDLTTKQSMPIQLSQQYIFIPSQVKLGYLVAVLSKILNISIGKSTKTKKSLKSSFSSLNITEDHNQEVSKHSVIIFTNSCKRCQEISETLSQLSISNVPLHSMMSQNNRIASLSKFRNQYSRILICTDVASRGLDISSVDIVINFDLPKIISDYIHRVGRTARAGKKGTSISFITQFDVELVQTIEDHVGSSMELYSAVNEEDVVKVLNTVAKASRLAELKLLETGFEDKVEVIQIRKRKVFRKQLRKARGKTTGDDIVAGNKRIKHDNEIDI